MGETKEQVTIEFSADGTKLESGVSGLQRKAQRAGDAIKDAFKFKGERVVATQFRGFITDIGQATTASEVASSAVTHFGEALKVSIGAMIGIQIGIALLEKYEEQLRKVRESQLQLNKTQIETFSPGASLGAIESGISALAKLREDAQKNANESFTDTVSDFFGSKLSSFQSGIVPGMEGIWKNSGTQNADAYTKQQQQAERAINVLLGQQTQKMTDQASVARERVDISEREAQKLDLITKRSEAIAGVWARAKELNVGDQGGWIEAQVAQVNKLFDAQTDYFQMLEDNRQTEIQTTLASRRAEMDATNSRNAGDEEEARHIENSIRLEQAKAKIQEAIRTGSMTQEQGDAQTQIEGAIFQQNNAMIERDASIRAAQLATETRIANVTGTASDRKAKALKEEISLQRDLAAAIQDPIKRQEALNKATEANNTLIDLEIANRHMSGQQRAQETIQKNARKSQQRIDDAKARNGMSQYDFDEAKRRGLIKPTKPKNDIKDNTTAMAQNIVDGLTRFFADKTLLVSTK